MYLFDDIDKHRRYVGTVIASDILYQEKAKEKAKNREPFNQTVFNNGMHWYNEGFSLEEAPVELRSNSNFVNGYALAQRRNKINKSLEIQGAMWYYEGKSLDEIPDNMKDNEFFRKGYADAMNGKKRR